ncbi:glutathionylspermidine synthase family protein [Candidatus Trichorickettsia mobilis]|uniref:glutathionylspermidine synthase family protein n=1 Tax=Candidatus Trichorickettsia mobilis TaxID=1346319 RepID=UPI002931E034|nr:glutathionylspermidine synthase family protein [Candidatus Trichorickettsia mobilis]
MERIVINPRQGWQDLVENLGFYFHTIDNEIYWDESAYYHLSLTQVDQLEQATEVLHSLCEKAVRFIIENKRYEGFGFSPLSIALIEQSYNRPLSKLIYQAPNYINQQLN